MKHVLLLSYIISVMLGAVASAEVFLPGTQPKEGGIEFAKVAQCYMCHSRGSNGYADVYFSWQGGMMANAARDPLYRAALAIANQDIDGVGEFCWRCHAPRGWLQDRSKPADGTALNEEDMHGVSCDICHSLRDPMSKEGKELAEHDPPGYGNAMMVADPANVAWGPYDDARGAMPHETGKSDFHASGDLCGTCHDVSNPFLAKDVKTQRPYEFGHIERTYSEWALSDFAKEGKKGSCQSCHYPAVEGGGWASRYSSRQRDYFVKHGPVGGSTWVQKVTALLWKGGNIDTEALNVGIERSRKLLKTAAKLEIEFQENSTARLRVTNLTGHKLPTGYPEGRRMWVNVKYLDSKGNLLVEYGRYGDKQDSIFGKPVTVPTLLDESKTTVYEIIPGLSEAQAKKFGIAAGPSFHFIVNDKIYKDNRIPPRGFKNAEFARHLCEPVGAMYFDGQHWDDVKLDIAKGSAKVVVKLMYQSASWEYIKFLAEENRSDDWGRRLYYGWQETGKCAPEVIAEIEVEVP